MNFIIIRIYSKFTVYAFWKSMKPKGKNIINSAAKFKNPFDLMEEEEE